MDVGKCGFGCFPRPDVRTSYMGKYGNRSITIFKQNEKTRKPIYCIKYSFYVI